MYKKSFLLFQKITILLTWVYNMHSSLTYKNQRSYCFLMATLAMDSSL